MIPLTKKHKMNLRWHKSLSFQNFLLHSFEESLRTEAKMIESKRVFCKVELIYILNRIWSMYFFFWLKMITVSAWI